MSTVILGKNTNGINGVVPNKQDILMKSLTEFFQNSHYIHEMLPIIHGDSKISLRIIDWFVTGNVFACRKVLRPKNRLQER